MPSRHYFLIDPPLYVARFTGVLTLSELLSGVAICRDSPHFDPGKPQLIDLTAVDEIDLDFDAMRRFVSALATEYAHNDRGISMIIATAGNHYYGASRQFELLSAGIQGFTVHVTASEQEALAALGLPDFTVDALLARATDADGQRAGPLASKPPTALPDR